MFYCTVRLLLMIIVLASIASIVLSVKRATEIQHKQRNPDKDTKQKFQIDRNREEIR